MSAYLTPEAVAAQWGVSASHVRKLCQRGELQAIKTGSGPKASWRIPPGAVEVFELHHANEPEAHPELMTVAAPVPTVTRGPGREHTVAFTEYAEVVRGPVPWRSTVIEDRPALSRGSGAKKRAGAQRH